MEIKYKKPITVRELIEFLNMFDLDKTIQLESSWGEYQPDELYTIEEDDKNVILKSSHYD